MLLRRGPTSSRFDWLGSGVMIGLAVFTFGSPSAASQWMAVMVALGLLVGGPAQMVISLRRSRRLSCATTLRGLALGVVLSFAGWWGISLLENGKLQGVYQWLLVLPSLIVFMALLKVWRQQRHACEKALGGSYGAGLEVVRRGLGLSGICLLPRLELAMTVFVTMALFFGTVLSLLVMITNIKFTLGTAAVANLLHGMSTVLSPDVLGWILGCSLVAAGLLPADFTPDPKSSL